MPRFCMLALATASLVSMAQAQVGCGGTTSLHEHSTPLFHHNWKMFCADTGFYVRVSVSSS